MKKKVSKKFLKERALSDLTVFLLSEILDSKIYGFRDELFNEISERFSSLNSVDLKKVLFMNSDVDILKATIRLFEDRFKRIEDKLFKQ
jgi:hypothetical protein